MEASGAQEKKSFIWNTLVARCTKALPSDLCMCSRASKHTTPAQCKKMSSCDSSVLISLEVCDTRPMAGRSCQVVVVFRLLSSGNNDEVGEANLPLRLFASDLVMLFGSVIFIDGSA